MQSGKEVKWWDTWQVGEHAKEACWLKDRCANEYKEWEVRKTLDRDAKGYGCMDLGSWLFLALWGY